jgi:hypothetical protein
MNVGGTVVQHAAPAPAHHGASAVDCSSIQNMMHVYMSGKP